MALRKGKAWKLSFYTFEDADGNSEPLGPFHTQDYEEARNYASRNGLRVIANTYEWTDSEPVDDFTGKE